MKRIPTMNEKGATAVEFAIVLPVLLLFIFGIIEFSVLLYNKAMITNGAREGARTGVVYIPDWIFGDPDDPEIKEIKAQAVKDKIHDVVTDSLQDRLIHFGGNRNDFTITTDYELNDNDEIMNGSGDPLTVSVDYTHRYLIIPRNIGESHLSAQIKMRIEL